MPTESTFLLAGLFLLLAAAGWAMGRFGERDEEQAPPPLPDDVRQLVRSLERPDMLARRIAAEEALAQAERKQEEQKKNIQSLFDKFWFDQQTEVPEISLARSDPAEQEEID